MELTQTKSAQIRNHNESNILLTWLNLLMMHFLASVYVNVAFRPQIHSSADTNPIASLTEIWIPATTKMDRIEQRIRIPRNWIPEAVMRGICREKERERMVFKIFFLAACFSCFECTTRFLERKMSRFRENTRRRWQTNECEMRVRAVNSAIFGILEPMVSSGDVTRGWW